MGDISKIEPEYSNYIIGTRGSSVLVEDSLTLGSEVASLSTGIAAAAAGKVITEEAITNSTIYGGLKSATAGTIDLKKTLA